MLVAPAAASAASAELVYPKSWINRYADVSDTAAIISVTSRLYVIISVTGRRQVVWPRRTEDLAW